MTQPKYPRTHAPIPRGAPFHRRFSVLVRWTPTHWYWMGKPRRDGYGVLYPGGKGSVGIPAHRASYMIHVGPIPKGYEIDHLCRTPECVNPDHLEAVPPRINNLRSLSPAGLNARKTVCKYGHPFDVMRSAGPGRRKIRGCLTCERAKRRGRRAA